MNKKLKNYIYISLFSIIITVCSWISISSVIPFSLQTFAVFLAINLIGYKSSALSIGLYILLGSIGLPVFTGFKGGLAALVSPTGGFIFGFLLIPLFSYLVGFVFKNNLLKLIIGELTGLLFCYITGALWFSLNVYGLNFNAFGTAVLLCVVPYILPDIIKLILAYFIYSKIKTELRKY